VKLEEPSALWQLPAGTYDAITLWHVLEHVHQLRAYIERFHHLLTAEGKILSLFLTIHRPTQPPIAIIGQRTMYPVIFIIFRRNQLKNWCSSTALNWSIKSQCGLMLFIFPC
jgi:2-polyprenyl-3-methyl-5-hydroxy-6-metoxy-1,4-benzoquinol methylase